MPSGSVPAGTRVGRYEIVSLLRQGGMGEVYAADDCNLGRRVALKILPRNRTSDPERVARFVREARASSTLNHPSIVAVHDAGSEGDLHFLAMELIDGQPLSEWMRRRQSIAQRVEVMAQVADGLAQAHDAGIVHRDLKPDNVMVTPDGRAKIVDFGVAKLTERIGERAAVTGVTTPTSRVGTTAYMAPEQIEGKSIDHRTDVFAFGVVLFEVLTGANPFASAQYADTIHNVVHLEPPLERVPPALHRVVKRCLRKEPELRYDSLRDVALDLREAELELAPPRRRRRWLGAIAALLIAGAAAAWWVWSHRQNEGLQRGMTMTRLTHNGGVSTAALSPDGKYLVHAVREGADEALYVKQIATGQLTKIAAAAPLYYFDLKVSADGNYAYYIATDRAEPNVASLYQISLLGGDPRLIAADTEFNLALSPDGTQVAFRRFNAFDREHRITIAAIDGSGEQIVVRRRYPEFANSPVFEPGGKSITFIGGDELKREGGLYRLTLATSAVEKIPTPEFPGVGTYAWLPDGSGILATVFDREQPPQIWFVPSGKTEARKVTSEVSAYFGVTPSADAQSFAAVREVTDSNIYTMNLGSTEPPRALTSGFGNWVGGGGVQWLNEREVAFSATTNGENTVYAVSADGGTPRRLVHNLPVWNFSMSPDETHMAFVSDKSGTAEIWMADANGANARQVTSMGNVGAPSFTADGRSIIFASFSKWQYAWRVPVDGSAPPVRLTDIPTNQPQPSPDGKWLVCRLRSTQPNVPLWRTAIVPVDRSGPPRFFNVPRFGGPPMLQWHPNGRAFLYIDYVDGVANVWAQDLDGSAPRRLTSFESGRIFSYDLAPDGKRMVISRGEQTRDAVLIRNFR
jgi:Tol biopolymer transport system component/predicted Ser/Thr protein kinase